MITKFTPISSTIMSKVGISQLPYIDIFQTLNNITKFILERIKLLIYSEFW